MIFCGFSKRWQGNAIIEELTLFGPPQARKFAVFRCKNMISRRKIAYRIPKTANFPRLRRVRFKKPQLDSAKFKKCIFFEKTPDSPSVILIFVVFAPIVKLSLVDTDPEISNGVES